MPLSSEVIAEKDFCWSLSSVEKVVDGLTNREALARGAVARLVV